MSLPRTSCRFILLLRRASSGASSLPHLAQNLMTRHMAAALEQDGHKQEAAAVKAAAKLCRKAAAAAASNIAGAGNEGPSAAVASVARQRADFWRAARKPWKVSKRVHVPNCASLCCSCIALLRLCHHVLASLCHHLLVPFLSLLLQPPPGWLPIPQGSVQPQLGRIAALPPQWWAVFPQYRHRHVQPAAVPRVPLLHSPPPAQQQDAEAFPAAAPSYAATAPDGATPSALQVHPQQRALRRVQQAGIRSILKGTQQSPPEQLPQWEPSQQLPVLVGSEPTSGRAGRRVQFQLPRRSEVEPMQEESRGGSGADQAQQLSLHQQEQQGALQEDLAAPAVAAEGEPGRSKQGKRRLLPQLPPSLALEDAELATGGSSSSWQARLGKRREKQHKQKHQ